MPLDVFNLLADLARLPWDPPHHIQAVNEEYEALLPLDVRLMQQIPPIDGQEFALPIRDQVASPVESTQPYVDFPEDSLHWPEYEGLDYVGVQEEYEWSLFQPEENLEDEIIVDNMASQHGPIAVFLETKRPEPITNDDMLLQGINPSASHIATIGLLQSPMPDATPPTFGPILEPSHISNK